MTFTQIQNEVQNTLARTDTVVVDSIPTWINRRQRDAALRHNFAFMRTSANTPNLTLGTQVYDLPSDYKDDAVFYLQSSTAYTPLPFIGALQALETFAPTDTGEPAFITLEPGATSFTVWPSPDATYTLVRRYFAFPTDLSGSSTNWFTNNFPMLLIAGGVAEGLHFLGAIEEAVTWERRFEAALKAARDYDVTKALPNEFTLQPSWNARGTMLTSRERAGWFL